MTGSSRTRQVSVLASGQHGVVSAAQLRTLGIDRSWVCRRVASGDLRPVLPRVYAVGAAAVELSPEGLRSAAVLGCRQPAGVGLETAARRHGIWSRAGEEVQVVTRTEHRPVPGYAVTFHRSRSLGDDDITVVGGIPTTHVTRTLLDLGRVLTAHQLCHVLCEASFRGLLDAQRLGALAARHRQQRGSAVVRRALELYATGSAGTRSRAEDHLLAGIVRHRLPEPLVNMRSAVNVRGIEPDLAWPHARLVVEVDGPGHERPGAREQDQLRDEALARSGWHVLRVHASIVWRDRATVLREIARLLGTKTTDVAKNNTPVVFVGKTRGAHARGPRR